MPRTPNLSSQMKIAIWEKAALLGRDDYAGIKRSLDYLVDSGQLSEDVPDTEKIRGVIADLQILAIPTLKHLPEPIWTLRDDFSQIQDRLYGDAMLRPGQTDLDNAMGSLVVEFDPSKLEFLGHKSMNGHFWQVACCSAYNDETVPLRECRAQLFLEEGTARSENFGPFELNPVDDPDSFARVSAAPIDIPPHGRRWWDVLLAPTLTDPQPSITSGLPLWLEEPRKPPSNYIDWALGGACIGTPITMSNRGVFQTHLLPGEYTARIEISDSGSHSAPIRLRMLAPKNGEQLQVIRIE